MTSTRDITLPGKTFTPLATPSTGSTELAVWRLRCEPGAGGQAHTLDREEVLTVVHGELLATLGTDTRRVGPGQSLVVPAGTLFEIANDSGAPAEVIFCAPAGITATMDGTTITPPWTR